MESTGIYYVTVCNVLEDYISNLVNFILSPNPYTDEDILSTVDGYFNATSEEILDVVNGTELTDIQKFPKQRNTSKKFKIKRKITLR